MTTPESLEKQITEAISKLLSLARELTWNNISHS